MFNERMKGLGQERSAIRELFEYGNARAKKIGRENVFDFSLGNPSVPAPDGVTQSAVELLQTIPAEKLHGYTSAPGASNVRKAIADDLNAQYGVDISAEYIYMTCGAAASLTCSLHALCNKGDEVIVVAPYFPEYRVFAEGAGATVVSVRAGEDFHLDVGAIERAITPKTKAIIVNSPNNPTGVVYGEGELRALADVLTKKGKEYGSPVYLLSDEPYRELTYGVRVPFLMNLYPHTVVCYSFSKSLSLAGERIGYVAVCPRAERADDLFAAICGAGRSLGFVCAPSLFQRVVAGQLGKTVDLSAYRENRALLYGALTYMGFTCVYPDGAFYLFVKSPFEDAVRFCERAKKHELLLVPSDSFGIDGYVRLSYCVKREMIERSIPAFEALARECLS